MPFRARQRKGSTRLARVREWRGLTQAELADAIGISVATLRRLETGETANPTVRYLANAALALHVALEDVCEPEWLAWTTFDAKVTDPPEARGFLYWPQETRPPKEVLDPPVSRRRRR